MIRKQTLIPLFILTVVFFISSCSHTIYNSTWQTGNFAMLNKSETSEPLRFFDQKSKLQYDVTNDYTNIYICIKATDQQSQIKIMRAGMTVGIDTLGKKKPQVEILFPFHDISSLSDENKKDWHNKSDTNSRKKQFMTKYKEIHVSGFKTPINGILPLHNDYGIYVNITWDSLNIMYYKAIIPFKTFTKDSLTTLDSNKVYDFSVTVNAIAMQRPSGEESGSEGGGMMHDGGMGGMHGGGMGGGMHGGGGHNGGGSGGMSSMSEATTFNSLIKLAILPKQ